MSLIVPDTARPTNLYLSDDVRASVMIEGDVYNICGRIRELSDRLFVIQLNQGQDHAYAIMERCEDGVDRLFCRVKELDNRVVKRLQAALQVPLNVRYGKLEEEERRMQEEQHEAELDELYEQLGGPMYSELEKCGFVQRPKSYPKTGVAKPGKVR